jgi:hypothetical protein
MAPKKVGFAEESFHHQQQPIEDDDCQTHVSHETEYTYETIQTAYTYETIYTQAEPNEISAKIKQVWFSPQVTAQETLSLHDYTEKETRACWCSEEDKIKMNTKRMKVVARLKSGKAPRRGRTYRGLECSSVEGAKRLQATVSRHVDAVMDEQDRQWRLFRDDYGMLAVVGNQTSGASKHRALELAQLDAQAVLEEAAEELAQLENAQAVLEESAAEDLSSSETGSDDIHDVEVPAPVSKKQTRRSSTTSKKRTKKGRRKGDPPGQSIRPGVSGDKVLEQMASAVHQFKKGSSQKSPTIRSQSLSKIRL